MLDEILAATRARVEKEKETQPLEELQDFAGLAPAPRPFASALARQGAVNIIHRREIAAAEDPEEKRVELIEDYESRFNNPYVAAELGLVDEIIEPRETRVKLIRALEMLRTKREKLPQKKHGNGPQ